MKTLPQACLALAVGALMSAAAIAAEQAPTDAQIEAFLATLSVQEGETRPTVAEFRSTVIVDAQGRRLPTFAEFRDSVEWQWVPLLLVRAHYPEVLSRIDTPKDLTFAFVLKSKTEVVAHAARRAHREDHRAPDFRGGRLEDRQWRLAVLPAGGRQAWPALRGLRADPVRR